MGDEDKVRELAEKVALETARKIAAACNAPLFKQWDGNGGHETAWRSVGIAIAGVVLSAIIIAAGSSLFNRWWNIEAVNTALAKNGEKIDTLSTEIRGMRSDLDDQQLLNFDQNITINRNTNILWNKFFPGSPKPEPLVEGKKVKR